MARSGLFYTRFMDDILVLAQTRWRRGLCGGCERDRASRFQRIEGSEVDWSDAQRVRRPIREYLAALDGEQLGRQDRH